MKRYFKRWFPSTLRNRLFVTFVLMIFIPFSVLNVYIFQKIEMIFQHKISQQLHSDLQQWNRSLEEIMGIVTKTVILLEQDSTIESIFKNPLPYHSLERKAIIEDKLKSINNSLFLGKPQIYYTLIDFHGNMYASYQPKRSLNYSQTVQQDWYLKVRRSSLQHYEWVTDDENYVHPDISTSPRLLTLRLTLKDEHHNPYGVARISIDYLQWFEDVVHRSPIEQRSYILDAKGNVVASKGEEQGLNQVVMDNILNGESSEGYFIDDHTNTMINYHHVKRLNWYLVNQVDLNVWFSEMNALKTGLFVMLIIFAVLFVIFTFLISRKMTRPLMELQKKMADLTRKDRKVYLPEDKYKGEVLVLTQSFNRMVRDINELIEQLKVEERQKQAIRFQMLLSQMNPHFLLNTLNSIKWIAFREKNDTVVEICIALGRLLETSLNSDVELIYLKDELALLQSYLDIQKFRYQERFTVDFEYEEHLQYALVPKFSLQPLVENSIYHGFYDLDDQGNIRVRVRDADQQVIMEVSDNGIGMEAAKRIRTDRKREGIGLKNIRERLNLLFGSQASFECDSSEEGTTVRMRFPLLLSTPYEKGGENDVDRAAR